MPHQIRLSFAPPATSALAALLHPQFAPRARSLLVVETCAKHVIRIRRLQATTALKGLGALVTPVPLVSFVRGVLSLPWPSCALRGSSIPLNPASASSARPTPSLPLALSRAPYVRLRPARTAPVGPTLPLRALQTPTAAALQARQPLPSRHAPMVSSPPRARPPTLHASLVPLGCSLRLARLPVPRAQTKRASTALLAPTPQQVRSAPQAISALLP